MFSSHDYYTIVRDWGRQHLLAYCANNPVMYSDITGCAPEWLNDVLRFVGGVLVSFVGTMATLAFCPLLIVPGFSAVPLFTLNMTFYGAMLVASPFSSLIKSDLNLIKWNPCNGNANAVASSNDISFYKGVFVFRYGKSGGGGISFGIIGLGRGASANTIMHEYGHHKQQRLIGLGLFTPIVGISSLISAGTSQSDQHANRWYEMWATDWGNSGWIWW